MDFIDVKPEPIILPPAIGSYMDIKSNEIIHIINEFQLGLLSRYEATKMLMNVLGPMLYCIPVVKINIKTKDIIVSVGKEEHYVEPNKNKK